MKRGTPRNPKVTKLAKMLSIEVAHACGLLELLWHFTAEFAPDGHVGRHSNDEIVTGLLSKKDPNKLIEALISARWIDSVPDLGLVIHDWPEHAEDSVHMKLARARMYFCDGTAPRLTRLPKSEREVLVSFYALPCPQETHTGQGLAKARQGSEETTKNLKPEKPEESLRSKVLRLLPFDEIWPRFVELYFETGSPLIINDFAGSKDEPFGAKYEWEKLDTGARLQLLKYLRAKIDAQDTAFLMRPAKLLRTGEFQREVKPQQSGYLTSAQKLLKMAAKP